MLLVAQELIQKISSYFPPSYIPKAKSIVENSQISISFQKGNSDRFFTISGLMLLNSKYETRMSFKRDPFKLTSNCNCKVWSEENHCHHVASLFLHFLLSEKLGERGKEAKHLSLINQGVHPEVYGSIIKGANRLPGSNQNSTYSSLQYTLVNQKVINFPLPRELDQKIILSLQPAHHFPEYELLYNADKKLVPIFSLKNSSDEIFHKISLFEYLYIFNWETGEAFHQPAELKTLVRKLKGKELDYSFNDFIRLTTELTDKNILELYDNDVPLSLYPVEKLNLRFKIDKSKRKNYLKFCIETFDSKENKVTPPEFFSTIVYDNGLLNSFRTKNDAEEFIQSLLESFETKTTYYKKHTYGSDKRDYLSQWIDILIEKDFLTLFEQRTKAHLKVDTKIIRIVISSLFNSFGSNLFRFSQIEHDEKVVSFEILKSSLLEGIAKFYHTCQELGLDIFYNDFKIKNWSSSIRFERESSNLNWFDLTMSVSEEDIEIIKKSELSDNFLITKDRLVILDSEQKKILKFMKKYTKFEAINKLTKNTKAQKFKLNFQRARIFELFELKKLGIEGALTKEETDLCEKLLNLKSIPKFPVPANFVSIARDYQLDGYHWLRFLFENGFGACLADDMGLGKTLQTIMFLQSILDKIEKAIIICPVSILINWENEINKFSNMTTNVYYGEGRALQGNEKIILTSYGVMKKESIEQFSDVNFDIVIFDEVQQLKNIKSLGASAARNLRSRFRICLTGTPVENDLSEFYNIMDLAVPGVWGELGFIRSQSSKKNRLLARQTVRPFILRRTKEQVLKELPDKVEQYIYIPFSQEEKNNYITKLLKIKQRVTNVTANRKYGEVLKNLLELRQLCLWQKKDNLFHSAKIEFLIENLEQIVEEGHKAIIFSQFTTYLDFIQNNIVSKKWKFSRIDGSQNMKKRQQEVDKFQEGDSTIFLISLKAGGFGLNLTAASYIFLMDPWWNPAVENQAIDRAHRIGQENKLTVYRPIIKDSIEEKVLVLQNNKKELFKDLMAEDDENFFNGKLTMEDFQNLLS